MWGSDSIFLDLWIITTPHLSGGKDSNLRRENPTDLQSVAIGHSATSGLLNAIISSQKKTYQLNLKPYSLTKLNFIYIIKRMERLSRPFRIIRQAILGTTPQAKEALSQTEDQAAINEMLSANGLAWHELPHGSNAIAIDMVDLTKHHHPHTPLCVVAQTDKEGPYKGLIAVDLKEIGGDEKITLEIFRKGATVAAERYTSANGEIRRQIFDETGTERRRGRYNGQVYFDGAHQIGKLNISHKQTTNPHRELMLGINLHLEINDWRITPIKFPATVPAGRSFGIRVHYAAFHFSTEP